MRFELFALPVLAAIGSVNAAAVSSKKAVTTTTHTTTKHVATTVPPKKITSSSKKTSSSTKKPATSSGKAATSSKKAATSSGKAATSSKKAATSSGKAATPSKAATTSGKATTAPFATAGNSTMTTGPSTISDTASAISSVMSAMSAQSPSASATSKTVTVTGSAVPGKSTGASASASKTTTKAATSAKTSSAKTSAKSTASTKASTTTGKKAARDVNTACATQPTYGYTYVPSPTNSPAAFLADSVLHDTALAASAPSGYNWLYAGYYASLQQNGFLSSMALSSYNQTQCASACTNTNNCHGFTIYYERDPMLAPAPACPLPGAFTNVRCVLYDRAVNASLAVNVGEWRGGTFPVVIAGANGYNRQCYLNSPTTC